MEFMVKPQAHGAETGPYSAAQILDKVKSGSLQTDFLVQPRGGKDWTTISALFGLPTTESPSQPYQPSVQPTPNQRDIAPIIRDTLIVWVFTAVGGFISGSAAGSDPDRRLLGLAISNLLLGTVAFTIVGYLAPADKWRHLRLVALAAWLSSLINVAFFGVSIATWFFGAFVIVIIMAAGGSLAYLFKKQDATAAAPLVPTSQAGRATLHHMAPPPPPLPAPAAAHSCETDHAEHRLSNLKRLYEQGLINSDEYTAKRQQILAGL